MGVVPRLGARDGLCFTSACRSAMPTPSFSGPPSEAAMYHTDDPEDLAPEERLEEVASILARGFLRLKKRNLHLVGQLAGHEKSSQSPGKGVSPRILTFY